MRGECSVGENEQQRLTVQLESDAERGEPGSPTSSHPLAQADELRDRERRQGSGQHWHRQTRCTSTESGAECLSSSAHGPSPSLTPSRRAHAHSTAAPAPSATPTTANVDAALLADTPPVTLRSVEPATPVAVLSGTAIWSVALPGETDRPADER